MKKETVITLACVPVCYDENGSDVAYAVVTLNKKYIETLLARISLVKGLKHLINSLYHLEEFDYTVEYLRYSDTPCAALADVDDAWKDVSDGEVLDGSACPDPYVRVDVPTLLIQDKSVYWKAVIKHTNIKLATAHLDEKYLAKMIKQLGGKV